MAYSKEIYAKAQRVLEKRRDDAVMFAQMRANEIKDQLPEVNEIQNKLSAIGCQISKTLFMGEKAAERIDELRLQSKALIKQRSEILQKNGYSENAMQAEYVCPVCEDRGFLGGKMCSCHKQLLKDIMRSEINALAPLDNCTFDKFDVENYSTTPLENSIVPRYKAEKVFEASRRFAQNFSSNSKNLLFVGGAGLGKTHLSLAIANVVINKGYYVCYGTSQNICDDLQAEQFGRGEEAYYSKNQVLGCDLLVLDDLGTEVENQYSVATIYNIVNTRILSGKPTIISTNCNFSALEKRYGKRITSRLTGEYTLLYLFGTDIRNL